MRDHTWSFIGAWLRRSSGPPGSAVHVFPFCSARLFPFKRGVVFIHFFNLLLYVLFLFTFADLLLYFDTALRLRPVGHGTLV